MRGSLLRTESDGERFELTNAVLEEHGYKKSEIIAILQDVQRAYRYLPEDLLWHISRELKISPAKIYSIATFYENFSLQPKGKYVIKICDGTACHVRKSIPILNALQEALSLTDKKHTTEDMMFTVETVSCLGACGLAPVITVNDVVYPAMTPEKTKELLESLSGGESI
ncbi:MAG: complex I 24 kDa subunit family protein [Christensenellales bacterium]|jgi:NADH-quinone oxidoreductase subunit E